MKVTRVSTAVLEANFDWTIVKVETDRGVTGYGEAFVGPGLPAVVEQFGRVLIGEELDSIDRILRRLRAMCVYVWPGLTAHAIYGIETAMLDAIGKRHGMPVWQILGGKYRDRVQVYADCHAGEALESIDCMLRPRTPEWMGKGEHARSISIKHHAWDPEKKEWADPAAYAARARAMIDRGFTMLKFDVDVPMPFETDEYNRDLSRQEIETASAIVAQVYEAIRPAGRFAIDCHWNYGVDAAVRLARALEPYDLLWLEDPLPPENIPAFAEVQTRTSTTIATGENHYDRVDFQRLITEGKLRLLAPDVQKIGLWDGRKVADLADMHYVNLTLHNISGPIGTMAGVHLSAAIPNVLALEWHAASVPFFDELVKNRTEPMIEGGKIRVPDAPGLGVELDEEVAWKYRRTSEKFFGD